MLSWGRLGVDWPCLRFVIQYLKPFLATCSKPVVLDHKSRCWQVQHSRATKSFCLSYFLIFNVKLSDSLGQIQITELLLSQQSLPQVAHDLFDHILVMVMTTLICFTDQVVIICSLIFITDELLINLESGWLSLRANYSYPHLWHPSQ